MMITSMNKRTLIYMEMDSKNDSVRSTISEEKQTIKEFLDLTIALENVLIYTIDLKAIHHKVITSDLPYICKTFEYKDKCYSLKIKSHGERSLTFKDYYHFLPFKEDSEFLDKYYNILLLSSIIKKEFNIDIGHKRILSISSIAVNIYKKYKESYSLIARLSFTQDAFIRKAYIGGRTEIYRPIYMKESYYYDVNSLYPYIMANKDMPVGIPILRSSEYFKDNDLGEFFGFIDIEIQVPTNISICILGLDLGLENTGIIYPKGLIKGVYFSEELNLAKSRGYRIVKIHKAYEFQRAIIFKEYVDKLYGLRVSSKGLLNHIYKKLLNTLYGRFGCVYTHTVYNEDDTEFTSYDRFMNVGIAAAITSYARIHMYNIIEPLSKHLLYIDTDGIFLDCRLPKEYVQNKLGCFKLVSENTACVFYGSKFYMYKRIGDNHYTKVFRGLSVNKNFALIKT